MADVAVIGASGFLAAPAEPVQRDSDRPQSLSIIIPVYNELRTIGIVLDQLRDTLQFVPKEIVIVDDCSTDGTRDWLRARFGPGASTLPRSAENQPPSNLPETKISVVYHDRNRGKGAALRSGLASATGDVLVIQDADLEYDPADWFTMWGLIADRRVADIVYGSRFFGRPHRSLYFHHYLANRLISFLYNAIYNQTIHDVEVCYKMFTREVLNSLSLTCDDFGFEIEFSAKIARARRWRIYELGISYYGRTYQEGKKISWRDGLLALWYLLKFRI